MRVADCLVTDEVFTHVADDGTVMHINPSAMLRDAVDGKGGELALVAMEPGWVQFIESHRGIERWKVNRLTEAQLSVPVIGACMPDGSVLTVDGHHRLVRLSMMGRTEYYIFLFQFDEWQKYRISDMPRELHEYAVAATLSK